MLPDGFSFTSTITLAFLSEFRVVEYKKIDYDDLVIKIKSKKYIKTAAMIGQYAAPLDLRR